MCVTREQARTTALDALALIACAAESREQDGDALLITYSPAEFPDLFLAVLAHSAALVNMAAGITGTSPDALLGAIAAGIREAA